jgi:hypothetical protein
VFAEAILIYGTGQGRAEQADTNKGNASEKGFYITHWL